MSAKIFAVHIQYVGSYDSGDRFNIKMLSYQYRDPHVKDKTVSRPSYLGKTGLILNQGPSYPSMRQPDGW